MISDSSKSAAFRRSVALLLQLHDEMTQGDPDGEAADNIRDAMEEPWYSMSNAEQRLVRGLSADLYTIGESRLSTEGHAPGTEELQRLVQENNWPEILELVRSKQDALPSDEAAVTRAVAWLHLGQPEISLRFFHEVERLRSLEDEEQIWLLTCLMQTERFEETANIARRFTSSSNPKVRLQASTALSLTAEHQHDGTAASQRQFAVSVTEATLPQIEPLIANDRTARILWRSSLFQLAIDYEESGDKEKAIAACHRILHSEPSNLDAQLLLASLTDEESSNEASQPSGRDFRRELRQRNAFDLPSFMPTAA